MRILLIDNYDSFTYNLYQQLAKVIGSEPMVVGNDQVSLDEIRRLDPDCIVLSPGPGHPGRSEDFGICAQVLQSLELPLLGVCLGHQGLAHYWGGSVKHAPEPFHGRLSAILHDESALYEGIPQGFQVVRYHSWVVSAPLPALLEKTAWTPDGLIMGLRHQKLPFWGVQFHPESVCTEFGDRLIENFLKFAERQDRSSTTVSVTIPPRLPLPEPAEKPLAVHHRRLDTFADPEQVFVHLYREEPQSFWLDSSLVAEGLSRFSFMGAANGPGDFVVDYRLQDQCLTIRSSTGVQQQRLSIFDFLQQQLRTRHCDSPELPFDFNCGFVGYLGYELKAECGARSSHDSPLPDAYFLFVSRALVFDHFQQVLYLIALGKPGQDPECDAWFAAVESQLQALPPLGEILGATGSSPVAFELKRDEPTYLSDIEACLTKIRDGESYEICLTNQIQASPVHRPLDLYRILRRTNPAPFAAFLHLGEVTILCSSPEQFLKLDRDRQVRSKPIKGTRARHSDPDLDREAQKFLITSEKDRAENLMIVDLLRNDLGRVCEIGTVAVERLMEVESYATVHQLVSTIRGRLRDELDAIDCVRAAFPGGSMTGAPKLRTMEIIDELEREARGIYAGALGYLGLNGTMDLNIVIRTGVATQAGVSIGVGGAVVALSEPQSEFSETLLKAVPLVQAITTYHKAPTDTERYLDGLLAHAHGEHQEQV